VETIVSELAVDHKDAFHVVRLSGFIHTDDKLALREIWRQLGREMNLEDDMTNQISNYADTMASLLALLSHPSEISGAEEGVTSRAVVFIIDEFDLFATHGRQTLLYNLFDIAQARKAPIAVLGLTTRVDVVESLEKRVKSRFSHRYVHLSLPRSLQAYWAICKQGLSVDEEDMRSEGLFDMGLKGLDEFRRYWDEKIETLYKTTEFQDHLEYHFYSSKSVPAFLTTCVLPLSTLSISSLSLRIPSAQPGAVCLEAADSKLHLLSALADLDLALLIAAARLDIIAHTDTVNFAMAYDEYSSQMGKQRVSSASSGMVALGAGGRVWGRGVAGMAWERLVALGFLIPAGIGGRSNAAHGGLEAKMWKLDVALEEIPSAVQLPGFLEKWCAQI
jgi:origin recognition complex subunit 4